MRTDDLFQQLLAVKAKFGKEGTMNGSKLTSLFLFVCKFSNNAVLRGDAN